MASLSTMAEGAFGKVYKMPFRGSWAAVKKVPVDRVTKEQLFLEMRVYEKARHKNLVRLLEFPWLKENNWIIPMEFICGENLETVLFNRAKSKIDLIPSVKSTIISGMCEGLLHLHSKNIVHQDLKPDNIMIEHGTHRAVIIDMGLAKFSLRGFATGDNGGNMAFAAPEIFKGHNARDTRSDVWAMGKIILETLTRYRPEPNDVCSCQVRKMLKDNPYTDVVVRMVKSNARERATMTEVIGEIRQIDTQQVYVSTCADKHKKCCKGAAAGNPDTGRKRHPKQQKPSAVVPTGADTFPSMSFPFSPSGDEMKLHGGERIRFREVVKVNGEIVKYNDITMVPNKKT